MSLYWRTLMRLRGLTGLADCWARLEQEIYISCSYKRWFLFCLVNRLIRYTARICRSREINWASEHEDPSPAVSLPPQPSASPKYMRESSRINNRLPRERRTAPHVRASYQVQPNMEETRTWDKRSAWKVNDLLSNHEQVALPRESSYMKLIKQTLCLWLVCFQLAN